MLYVAKLSQQRWIVILVMLVGHHGINNDEAKFEKNFTKWKLNGYLVYVKFYSKYFSNSFFEIASYKLEFPAGIGHDANYPRPILKERGRRHNTSTI